ncbi:hypothetical protein DYB32_002789 [Aphanomyces invadans]|uniref:Uncharacterized protein n=1 Tax=Aphanomyces invadans TaxID=157072 RepID=A0A418B2G9_9STRA|nr:hypothetical protein DYB32_002789 [Aphanomyces invadans]
MDSLLCPYDDVHCSYVIDTGFVLTAQSIVMCAVHLMAADDTPSAYLSMLLDQLGVVYIVGLIQILSNFVDLSAVSVGRKNVLVLLFTVWAADSGSYFTGHLLRNIGYKRFHPLARHLSPNKDIEGTVGGVVFGLVAMFIATNILHMTATGIITKGSGALGILTDKIDSSLRSSRSGGHKSGKSMRSQHPNNVDEKYIRDIIIELNESNFMVVDSATVPFVRALMVVPLTEAFPSELRLRMIDHIMVNGCAAMVSVMLVYLQRRQRDILLCTSVEAFERIHEDDYRTWLTQPQVKPARAPCGPIVNGTHGSIYLGQFDAFWKECMDVHKSNFSQVYAARNIFMRAKHFTFNMTSSARIARDHSFFQHNDVHRLHFDDYGWVGFDVDHTLVEFKLDVLLKLSFEKAYTHVQANYMNLRTAQPPVWLPHLAFRGIAVDTIKGNLLYITSTHEVIRGFHGSYELPQNVLGLHYPVQQQRAGTTSYSYLYTNAEIIFGPLYAWLVDQYEAGSITEAEIGYVPLPSGDIDHQMRHLHPEVGPELDIDMNLCRQRTLSTSPDTVIQINSGVRRMLEMLQKTWKKNVFLLTNGSWEHTDAVRGDVEHVHKSSIAGAMQVMKCAIGTDWSSLFDLVLTKATKEVFFESYHACRFRVRVVDPYSTDSALPHPAMNRHVGGAYDVAERAHSKVLYMGDHPLHDIKNPAQSAAAWDTVAVIQETSLLFKHLEKVCVAWHRVCGVCRC